MRGEVWLFGRLLGWFLRRGVMGVRMLRFALGRRGRPALPAAEIEHPDRDVQRFAAALVQLRHEALFVIDDVERQLARGTPPRFFEDDLARRLRKALGRGANLRVEVAEIGVPVSQLEELVLPPRSTGNWRADLETLRGRRLDLVEAIDGALEQLRTRRASTHPFRDR